VQVFVEQVTRKWKMDQLKVGLAKAAKHQFWILTGVALLLGIVGFYLTSSTLNSLFTQQKSAIESQFSNIQNVSSAISTHPNDISQAEMQKSIDAAAEDVKAAWESQYNRQSPMLIWPDDIDLPTLVQKLKQYRPIELKLEYPEEPKMVNDAEKRSYGRYFDLQMPKLAEIIGVTWVGEASAIASTGGIPGMSGGSSGDYEGEMGQGSYGNMMGGGGMTGGMMDVGKPVNRDIVVWPKSSQDELLNSIRLWRGETPSVYEIMYTQENMWILEGLLNIIKKTNGNAKANFQTAIREVEFIRLGRPAVGQAGSIDGGPASRGGASYEEMMGMADSSGSSMISSEDGDDNGSSGGDDAAAPVGDPANLRYVDAAFNPLTGDDLRSKMRSESPEDAYFAVAKRVPVRLRLKIDSRKVQHFLAACGNADLMLEVRQVRLGDTVAAGGSEGGYGGGYGGSSGGAKGMGDMGMGLEGAGGGDEDSGYGGMGGMGGMGGNALAGKKDTWLTPIEVYGVVYLFNPVNIDRLGLNKVTEDTQVEDTVDVVVPPVDVETPVVETPANTTPADATPADATPEAPATNDPALPATEVTTPVDPGTLPTDSAPQLDLPETPAVPGN
jgi:hypothetical protein